MKTLANHRSGATGATFSPNGEIVASTGGDGTLIMTQVADGRPLWRAPALLTHPPLLYTHRGWHELTPGAIDDLPPDAGWRTAVEDTARMASQSKDGSLLCLVTWDGVFELWNTVDDTVLFTDSHPGISRLHAVGGGCVTRNDDHQVRLVQAGTGFKVLAEEADAIGFGDGEIFVASENLVTIFDDDGARVDDGRGRSSRVGDRQNRRPGGRRNLEWTAPGLSRHYRRWQRRSPCGSTPQSPVTRIVAGPAGTVAAGFANGQVALWDLETGAMLINSRLHGGIVHLRTSSSGLIAVSELGQFLDWDLSALVEPRSEFMEGVRSAVPAVWENGRAVVQH